MEEKLSIKINIADRFYPLKIDRGDEEKIRKAAKLINDKFNEYKQKYSDKDIFDLLAMTSLQYATKYIESEVSGKFDKLESELNLINDDIDNFINENSK